MYQNSSCIDFEKNVKKASFLKSVSWRVIWVYEIRQAVGFGLAADAFPRLGEVVCLVLDVLFVFPSSCSNPFNLVCLRNGVEYLCTNLHGQ